MAPATPEERMAKNETETAHLRETLGEIRADLKDLPKVLRNQMRAAMRGQRRGIRVDIERAVEECRAIQAKECKTLHSPKPPEPAPKPDPGSWDFSWLKPVLIGLAILGSLIGGAIAAVRGGDTLLVRPPTQSQP
jgi:hypothetical protein